MMSDKDKLPGVIAGIFRVSTKLKKTSQILNQVNQYFNRLEGKLDEWPDELNRAKVKMQEAYGIINDLGEDISFSSDDFRNSIKGVQVAGDKVADIAQIHMYVIWLLEENPDLFKKFLEEYGYRIEQIADNPKPNP